MHDQRVWCVMIKIASGTPDACYTSIESGVHDERSIDA